MRDLATLEMKLVFSTDTVFGWRLCLRKWWDKNGNFYTLRFERSIFGWRSRMENAYHKRHLRRDEVELKLRPWPIRLINHYRVYRRIDLFAVRPVYFGRWWAFKNAWRITFSH